MAGSTIATEVHQTLDVHADFTAKIAFHFHGAVEDFANLRYFRFGESIGLLAQSIRASVKIFLEADGRFHRCK